MFGQSRAVKKDSQEVLALWRASTANRSAFVVPALQTGSEVLREDNMSIHPRHKKIRPKIGGYKSSWG